MSARAVDNAEELASDMEAARISDPGGSSAPNANAACGAAHMPKQQEDRPLPALFLDELPDDEEQHPDLAAMNTMMGELTPTERAESCKKQGNEALKQGLKVRKKFYLRQAVDHYTEGIAIRSGDSQLDSILHSNRAQAELCLGNNRNAMRDGLRAVQLDQSNQKAYFRAAKGAMEVAEWEKAKEICRFGLERFLDFPELTAILKEVDVRRAAKAEQERQVAVQHEGARAPARALAATLLSRGWRIGRPQITIGTRKPKLDEQGIVWPVMFIYPESMQNDIIEQFHEHSMFADHLDVMFGPDAPPLQWDTEQQYTRSRIEMYYLSHAAKPVNLAQLTEFMYGGWPAELGDDEGPQRYGEHASKWVRVAESKTLSEVLASPDYVVPGIPVFFVVAAGSEYKERFLNEDAFRV